MIQLFFLRMTRRRAGAEHPDILFVQRRQMLQLLAKRRKWMTFPRDATIYGGIERSIGGLGSEKCVLGRAAKELEVRVPKLRRSMLNVPRSPARR